MTKPAKAKSTSEEPIDPGFAEVVHAFGRDQEAAAGGSPSIAGGASQVTTGKMMASVGLKVNGKIFAMMVRGRFVAKLPRERVDELVRSGESDSTRAATAV